MSEAEPHDREEEAGTQADQSKAEEVPLQADMFGVKLRTAIHPRPVEDPDPKSWKEVTDAINKLCMAFVVHFFGCLSDTAKAYRSFVRGLGALTGAMAQRIGRSHEKADCQEEARAVQAVETITAEKAQENAETVFARLQAKGAAVAMQQLPNGLWIIITVRPELENEAIQCAQKMLEAPNEQMVSDKLELTESVSGEVASETLPVEEEMSDADIAEAVREDEDGGWAGD